MEKIKETHYERRVAERIKSGRGSGMGADYKPWNRVQDGSAAATCWRIRGWATGRRHDLPNMLHAAYFYMLDWPGRREITDIREQYPLLPVTRTAQIALDLNVRHPRRQPGNKPAILVTSFLVTSTRGLHARQVMYAHQVSKPHVQSRLAIEQKFWESQGVDWRLVTESDMPTALAENAKLLHKYVDLAERVHIDQAALSTLAATLSGKMRDEQMALRHAAKECDGEFGRKPGESLAIAYHLIATGVWLVDVNVPLDPAEPLTLLKACSVPSAEWVA